MAEESAENGVVQGEPGERKEEPKSDYCTELSEEQLKQFYEKVGDNEEAVRFMAVEILKLTDFTYEGNTAMIVDYFVDILMFAQDEQLSAPHTLLMYQLGVVTLENVRAGSSIKKTEKKFKELVFRWSVMVKNTNHVPLFTTIELQKIVPFFMETIFQHYRLFDHCFHHKPLQVHYYEEVVIETPEIDPLAILEELEQEEAARAAYWKAREAEEAEEGARVAAEEKARWLLENPRRPAEDLDEYIEFSVRDKVEEVMKHMQEQYERRRDVLYGRVQSLEDKA